MAPRASWKGYLKLSLVSCPIALYPAASSSERVSFNRINKKTGNRLKQQLVDAETGEKVEKEDIGRGYEIGKGQYLQVEDEEIEKIRIESSHTISIDTFVPRDFIQAMIDRAAYYGLTAKKIEPVVERGDVAVIAGREHPRAVARKRKQLEERIKRQGFEQTMEALAYTWFNRLVAIRFMELHGYLDHGYRVLSHPEGKLTPEILEHAEHVDLPGLKKGKVIDLKLAGNKESELYRLLLTAQCNALMLLYPSSAFRERTQRSLSAA
jgi:hypothetical protein